ncbi:MAG: hypothetical protein ACTTID_00170 [Bacillales bacterium]
MERINLLQNVILDVLENKKSLKDTFYKYFNNENYTDKELNICRNIIDIFFNKYYFFKYLSKDLCEQNTPILVSSLGISVILLNQKVFEQKNIFNFLELNFKKNKQKYNNELENLLLDISNSYNYEFKNIEKTSLNYLSVIFNLPIWFIKMIFRQNDLEKTKEFLKLIKHISYKKEIFSKNYILNSIYNEDENNYKKDDNYYYIIDKNKEERSDIFYLTNKSFNNLLSDLGNIFNKYITIYQEQESNLALDIFNYYYKKQNEFIFSSPNLEENINILKFKEKSNIENLKVYNFNSSEIISKISFKQNYIFYYPKSFNLNKFLTYPEYRINFDENNYDNLLEHNYNNLEFLSKYVEDKGYLIFLNESINKKENINIINKFLEKNKDFILDKQVKLDISKNEDFLYYSILRKVNNE